MGWLGSQAEGQDKSWGERIIETGRPLPLVEIEAGEYLLRFMQEMGPIKNDGMSIQAISDGAILDYMRGMGIELQPWEFSILRKMCRGFVDGFRSGHDRFSRSPMNRQQKG